MVDIYLDQPFFEISNGVGRQPGRGYVDETEAQWELLEETLIGWGELEQHVSELVEAVEYACRKSGVDVEVGQALVDQPAAG